MQDTSTKVDEFHQFQCNKAAICPVIGIPIDQEMACAKKPRKHFLKFFLDVSYYLCVIPYKVVDPGDGTWPYKKKTFVLQQILCFIVHITAILDQVTYLRSLPFGQVSATPKIYIFILTNAIHTAVIITFCFCMWRRSSQLCSLVATVQMCPIVSLWYPKKINLIMSLITLMYVIMAMLNPLFKEVDGYSLESLYEYHVERGHYMLFFSTETSSSNWNQGQNKTIKMLASATFDSVHFPNILFALFSYFANTSQYIVVYHADLLVNVMALTLWCATTFLINTLKQQMCKQAIVNYDALKILTGCINSVAGSVVLTYTVDSILYYATNLEALFTGKNWFSKVVVVLFLLSSVTWLHFASHACLQMDRFRDWIRHKDNRTILPSKSISIMLLLDEISTNSVGLSGNGLFTINYKFVAQAITTVMTYFILVIQFK